MTRLVLLLCLAITPCWARGLKISTWNLNWLTTRSRAEADLPRDVHLRTPADFDRLAFYARKLDADIIGFQEVDGLSAASRVFDPARYEIITIHENVTQQVGLAVRRTIGVVQNPDVTALDVTQDGEHKLRDGLDATLTLPGGQHLRVLVVHLKTGCQTDDLPRSNRAQCITLAAQIPPLAAWIAARQSEGVAFLVMGDFNRVFDRTETMGISLAQAASLLRATQGFENPCWDGAPFIDHIFLGGPARAWLRPGSLHVQIFQETGAGWKERLSDHCPVSVWVEP